MKNDLVFLLWVVAPLAGLWMFAYVIARVATYFDDRTLQRLRARAVSPPPRTPAIPQTPDGTIQIWGVVTCPRCHQEMILLIPLRRKSRRYEGYDLTPEDWMDDEMGDREWSKINLPGETSRWHCPECIESIKLVVNA